MRRKLDMTTREKKLAQFYDKGSYEKYKSLGLFNIKDVTKINIDYTTVADRPLTRSDNDKILS